MKYTLNFNPIKNSGDTNNEAAKSMRQLMINASRIRHAIETGTISEKEGNKKLAKLLMILNKDFVPVNSYGEVDPLCCKKTLISLWLNK